MRATIPAIVVGYRGRVQLLERIFGSGDGPKSDAPPPKMTAKLFGALFGGGPRRHKKKR